MVSRKLKVGVPGCNSCCAVYGCNSCCAVVSVSASWAEPVAPARLAELMSDSESLAHCQKDQQVLEDLDLYCCQNQGPEGMRHPVAACCVADHVCPAMDHAEQHQHCSDLLQTRTQSFCLRNFHCCYPLEVLPEVVARSSGGNTHLCAACCICCI